jgi:hypothetical protein
MKSLLAFAGALIAAAVPASAQSSPSQTATLTVSGATITVNYSAPSVKGREGKLFGKDGRIAKDPNYPIWRAGANAATSFHTSADLDLGGLAVPKGDYSLYINLAGPANWELIVNKQTKQWGLTYDPAQDLGRVKMAMSKPAAMVETLKFTVSDEGGRKAKLQLEWEDHIASVPIAVK